MLKECGEKFADTTKPKNHYVAKHAARQTRDESVWKVLLSKTQYYLLVGQDGPRILPEATEFALITDVRRIGVTRGNETRL